MRRPTYKISSPLLGLLLTLRFEFNLLKVLFIFLVTGTFNKVYQIDSRLQGNEHRFAQLHQHVHSHHVVSQGELMKVLGIISQDIKNSKEYALNEMRKNEMCSYSNQWVAQCFERVDELRSHFTQSQHSLHHGEHNLSLSSDARRSMENGHQAIEERLMGAVATFEKRHQGIVTAQNKRFQEAMNLFEHRHHGALEAQSKKCHRVIELMELQHKDAREAQLRQFQQKIEAIERRQQERLNRMETTFVTKKAHEESISQVNFGASLLRDVGIHHEQTQTAFATQNKISQMDHARKLESCMLFLYNPVVQCLWNALIAFRPLKKKLGRVDVNALHGHVVTLDRDHSSLCERFDVVNHTLQTLPYDHLISSLSTRLDYFESQVKFSLRSSSTTVATVEQQVRSVQ